MTPDLVTLLCSRYPLILPAARLPPRSGIGNGWFGVLDALCAGLQGATERGGPQVVAEQVGESFGVLHFDPHLTGVNDEQKGMIAQAIALSARTCEICGAPGLLIRIRRGGCRTRCAIHEAWRSDERIPTVYVYLDSETGQVRGKVADHGSEEGADHDTEQDVLDAVSLFRLMEQASEESHRNLQLVQLRDPVELQIARAR